MRRLAALIALLALLVAACTSDGEDPAPEGPGRLVVLDDAGDVVVMGPDGSSRLVVAESGAGEKVYAQPIWSSDGAKVSWAQAGPGGFAYAHSEPGSGETTEIEMPQFPYYAFWSPAGDLVGLLHDGPGGVVLELADSEKGESAEVDADRPYYFSWSPDGEGIVAHAGANRLVDRDTEGDQLGLRPTAANYLSPQWLSQGVLHVDGGVLVLDSGSDGTQGLVRITGLAIFVANPSGTRVAVQDLADPGGTSVALAQESVPANSVMVVDLIEGGSSQVTDRAAAGFFWSPDGEALLVLLPDETRTRLVASVWDGTKLTEYSTYTPSPTQVRDLFPFFPQYAQSLSFWSADSKAFVLVGELDGESGVWVHSVDADSPPTRVSGGSWAAWSP